MPIHATMKAYNQNADWPLNILILMKYGFVCIVNRFMTKRYESSLTIYKIEISRTVGSDIGFLLFAPPYKYASCRHIKFATMGGRPWGSRTLPFIYTYI